ncbi:MAG: hypothetical protein ACI9G1_006101 [Pirellulaceae bacterium]|jgi:hypothetical protein
MGLRFFLAGIMQGSLRENSLHDQDYRGRLRELLETAFVDADVYDPLADHSDSIDYDNATGREVFMAHNVMCRDVDVLIAFIPQASMGTAIEMWEAYRHNRVVVTISPLENNWVVKFCSHKVYRDLEGFELALSNGELAEIIKQLSS